MSLLPSYQSTRTADCSASLRLDSMRSIAIWENIGVCSGDMLTTVTVTFIVFKFQAPCLSLDFVETFLARNF